MKFLATIFIISTVLGQSARVFHDNRRNKGTNYSKYRCFSNLDNVAWGVRAERYVNVEFYDNNNCRGHWRRTAFGDINFRDSIAYKSIKLTYRSEDERGFKAAAAGSPEDSNGNYEDYKE
ncbi:hypothetical protein CONCODRAFT_12191 [Conidiobolus coronatus NRRL 28638]|uniref:Uncharacterized protein n=1 Tax=Conidiobolus coronatus (strain ATCC 28846 / CBS 209.66 / NRRL 28638) TaxID=796925 RepID=A0A137NTH4_CONC2|nr:hypothetical protein CONCODRAFT_12191 [Conidiobolus coronatus NRRL 28638]|eukprot:KXN66042.1 hypothetical protein CONCODRAFT_12191 [Conidiobolus coronatus NRRL 28638]